MSAKRVTILLVSLAVAAPVVAWQAASAPQGPPAPTPHIQNGRVETRTGAAIDREIAAVSSLSSPDPVWVAWRVPMIDGDRDMCSWYSDRLGSVRGFFLDDESFTVVDGAVVQTQRPAITPPTGPVPLEAGTGVIVLARLVRGEDGEARRIERLRMIGDDCPIDAGGRAVYWLSAVTAAESLRYLGGLAQTASPDRSLPDPDRRLAASAVRAIGYHRGESADALLDQLAVSHPDGGIRRQAASTLASLRGARGVATIVRLLGAAGEPADRRSLTSALGQSRDVSAIPALLQLARTHEDAGVRKEAVRALSLSRDSRAIAYMEELLKR